MTGELIAVGDMAEHMRISLIDPKYREQKEIMMAKIRDTTKGAHAICRGGESVVWGGWGGGVGRGDGLVWVGGGW